LRSRAGAAWGEIPLGVRLDGDAGAEWRHSWTVVLASALGVGLMSVPAYLNGVFIGPLQREFGWTRSAISSGMMLNAAAALLLGPFVGMAVDRLGARRIALAGSVAAILAIALLSAVNVSLWSWWAVWLLIALTSVCIKPMVWTAAVSSLFSASRGLALAVTLCGTAIASTASPILCNYLIARFGWRVAYLGLAAFLAMLVLPPVFLFFGSRIDQKRAGELSGRPEPPPPLAGVSAREGLTSFRFLRLTVAATTMVIAAVSCLINLVPILVAAGHSRAFAASVAGAAGLSNIVGRLFTGYLLDRINANLVAGFSVALPVAAFLLLLFAPGSAPAAVAASLIVGLSIGAELDTVAYLTTRHFGLRSFGLLFAVISGALGVASAAGPLLANVLYDLTHSYAPALWAYIPLSLVGAALFFTLGDYRVFTSPEEPACRPARSPARAY
jgi:MFS family permease